ncbi:hypothetical protein CEK28_09770 [Xenophilus sp. AP218F]|nr:hypothetical protein [Chromobacterium sp. ASV5]OWY39157.1 hypothetical protein CEK28_09770 [Xenophilus sp. AP218F]
MKTKHIYALSAGGLLLVACGAAWAESAPEVPSDALGASMYHGSAPLSQSPDKGLAEAERLAQLRTLIHHSAIHCNNPGCPLCHPAGSATTPL